MLENILHYTNLVLFDNKHMDPIKHEEFTGVGNKLILENLRMIVNSGTPVIIRVPLIPKHNDSDENMQDLAKLMNELGLKRIDLLPYHEFGKNKYERLGLQYKLGDLKPHTEEQVKQKKSLLESYGLQVGIG